MRILSPSAEELVRREFPLLDEVTYLNNAAQCPAPRRTVRVLNGWAERLMCAHRPPDVPRVLAGARGSLAELMGAAPEEITFIPNTSVGIGLAAASLPLRPGDRVLVPEPDHPSLVLPWLNLRPRGVRVDRVRWGGPDFREEELFAAVNRRTRVIALSHVQADNGFRCDLRRLGRFCRRNGLFLVVDAIQSLGVMPVRAREWGVSVLAAGGAKWLMGGRGNGCLFVRSDLARRMRPPLVGRQGVDRVTADGDLRFLPDARRFAAGAWNLPAVDALQTSTRLLLQLNPAWVGRRALRLADRLRRGLSDLDLTLTGPLRGDGRSPIVSFTTGEAAGDRRVLAHLLQRDVYVSLRGRGIRAGLHFFNRARDVDRMLEVLDGLVG